MRRSDRKSRAVTSVTPGSGCRRRRARSPKRSASQSPSAPDAERLGRVVAGGDEVDAGSSASAITCSRGSPVRKASKPAPTASGSEVGGRAGDDADPADRARARRRTRSRLAAGQPRATRATSSSAATPSPANVAAAPDRPALKSPNGSWRSQPEPLGEQRVVAELRVGVERQVVGGERDVVLEQRPQPLREHRASGRSGGSPRTARGGRARAAASSSTARSISARWRGDAGDDASRPRARRGPGGRSARVAECRRIAAVRPGRRSDRCDRESWNARRNCGRRPTER